MSSHTVHLPGLSSPQASHGPGVELVRHPRKFHETPPVSSPEHPLKVETVCPHFTDEEAEAQRRENDSLVRQPVSVGEHWNLGALGGRGDGVRMGPAAQRAASWDRGDPEPLAGHTCVWHLCLRARWSSPTQAPLPSREQCFNEKAEQGLTFPFGASL